MAIVNFKSSPIKSIYNISGKPTPELKKKLNWQVLNAARLSRLANNPASENKITLELHNNQDYPKIPQIIKKEKTISSPWTSSYTINTDLNSLPKENTPPNIYKNLLKSTIDHLKDFHKETIL